MVSEDPLSLRGESETNVCKVLVSILLTEIFCNIVEAEAKITSSMNSIKDTLRVAYDETLQI